ncbi:MAG: glycosyltransferase [Bacteroidetes bacterium HGW-Bacteroidetes-6]|jgi:dolichol-phosphate mannosyltransferase|nr:MAG: glycosyltransferase [Bacteroidetes bacterium HGW-Bacteroidetes-6]
MVRKKVSIVVPAFNEELNVTVLYAEVKKNIPEQYDTEFIFVDDGSKDGTLIALKELKEKNPEVFFISFSRNFGHQNALKAGIDHATGDCVISMDADLQHPPAMLPQLLEAWEDGYDVVYTVRNDKGNGTFFKNLTSRMFYRMVNMLSTTRIEPGAADFRLISKQVAQELSRITENYLFIRGLIAWMGFLQKSISYKPGKRHSGKTKYSFSKMVRFAAIGITSFSVKPLRISLIAGFIIALTAMGYGFYAIYAALFTTLALPGWGSLIASVLFIGGIQLMVLGVIGEYLGKMFLESKRRPNYIIKETNLEKTQ